MSIADGGWLDTRAFLSCVFIVLCCVCVCVCVHAPRWGVRGQPQVSVLKYHLLFLFPRQVLSPARNSPVPQAAWLVNPRDARISAPTSVLPHLESSCPQRPEELELQVVVSQLSQVLGLELGFSGRAVYIL